MKRLKLITNIVAALLFVVPLIAAYVFSMETLKYIFFYILLEPLHVLDAPASPDYRESISTATSLIALIPSSLLCGLIFGYLFNKRTVFMALLPAVCLGAYYLTIRHQYWYDRPPYIEYGFLALSFILSSLLGSRINRKLRYTKDEPKMIRTNKLGHNLFTAIMSLSMAFALWLQFYYCPFGTRISGAGFEGIIISKASEYHDWWHIERDTITDLETRLHSYVKSHPDNFGNLDLPSYRRWYTAQLSNTGEKEIDVFMMHKSHTSRSMWLHTKFGVLGGGDNYWHLKYSLKDGTFKDIQFNADA